MTNTHPNLSGELLPATGMISHQRDFTTGRPVLRDFTTGRPVLLDLFCGAGGAAMGYARAGFEVIGVDSSPMPRYPFRFIRDDALTYLRDNGSSYDVIHASPPCQGYSVCSTLPQCQRGYKMLVPAVRELLITNGRPWVMENVVGAPLNAPIMLCGTMFGLALFRHRLFESNCFLMQPPHAKHTDRIGFGGFCCVAGHGDAGKNVRVPADHRTKAAWELSMGIDWMQKPELAQAIPPVYTEFLGRQLLLNIVPVVNAPPTPRTFSAIRVQEPNPTMMEAR